MGKVGIITFLHNDNFGSSLQAYALQKTIKKMGKTCVHLDYLPDRTEKVRNLLVSGNNWKLVAEGLRKKNVKKGQEGAREKSRAIQAFYEKRMDLTGRCRNGKELAMAAADCDTLICGSDQIWNPVWLNPAYFLTFAGKEQKKTAYAASLGIRAMPDEQKARKIRKWTEGFSAISVREDEGADILENITGKRPAVMPDPVCLLKREEWEEIAASAPEGAPYLLCYFIGENTDYWKTVEKIRLERGLRVLVIPVTSEGYERTYEKLEGIGPEAFLGAVKGAACFCTDSFHGLVFGTIFGVNVVTLRRYADSDPENKNSRVDHFLRIVKEKGINQIGKEGIEWLEEMV